MGSDRSPTHGASAPEKKKYARYLGYLLELAPQVVQEQMKEELMEFELDMKKSEVWSTFPPFVRAQVEARLDGRFEGTAEAIVLVLRRHGIELDEDRLRHIRTCTDRSRLDNWLLRAVEARSVADVFEDDDPESPETNADRSIAPA